VGSEPNVEIVQSTESENKEIVTEGVTPVTRANGGYVVYEGGLYKEEALKEIKPHLFNPKQDEQIKISTNFGTSFPKIAGKGDIFVRVDVVPNRLFKFDGHRWIEINRDNTQSYLADNDYIEFLISKISTGEYDSELLTELEKEVIAEYLRTQNT
jgi:hypothetical protein